MTLGRFSKVFKTLINMEEFCKIIVENFLDSFASKCSYGCGDFDGHCLHDHEEKAWDMITDGVSNDIKTMLENLKEEILEARKYKGNYREKEQCQKCQKYFTNLKQHMNRKTDCSK